MSEKQPVLASLRKAFTEAEISPGHRIFEVVEPVVGDPSVIAFRVIRVLSDNPNKFFVAKVASLFWYGVHITCFVGDKFFGNPEFRQFPPPDPMDHQQWLDSIVVATFRHCEKVRCELSQTKDLPPSLAGD